jgi:peptidoglycan/xylan/chitin deacetylase (PgdA/CDA1 family)
VAPFFRVPAIVRFLLPGRVWNLNRGQNVIYLTFDDGPDPRITPWVLDLLKEAKMKATFFCVGENVRRYPEIYNRICSEGHAVGNHTMRHEKGIITTFSDYVSSVEEASSYILSPLFRPPYGRMTLSQAIFLRKKYTLVMWNWLSYDYDLAVPVELILKKARMIRKGDIVVFHDNVKSFERLKQILPEFLAVLNEKQLISKPIKL